MMLIPYDAFEPGTVRITAVDGAFGEGIEPPIRDPHNGTPIPGPKTGWCILGFAAAQSTLIKDDESQADMSVFVLWGVPKKGAFVQATATASVSTAGAAKVSEKALEIAPVSSKHQPEKAVASVQAEEPPIKTRSSKGSKSKKADKAE